MIPRADDYATVYERFRWNVPERYNMAHDACDRHAVDPGRVALVVEGEAGGTREWTFHRIRQLANRCANLLEACGVEPGDRVAILLGQAVETAVVNLACFKCGAVSMPLFTKFGLEDLEFRLADGAARVLVTDIEGFARGVAPAVDRLPHLETVLTVDGETDGTRDFWRELKRGSVRYQTRATRAEDPAVLLYTSGTTGSPKGVLHAQRILLGHIPGMDFANNYLGQAGDRLWSPADWAWIGGLFDVLMPAWYYGLPVIAAPRPDFDPEQALDILARHAVRNTLLLPTMLKLMAQVPGGRRDVALRSVFTGGEPVGADVMAWAEETLGAAVNEIYGQTECNLVAGGCSMLLERRPGAIGVPIPGHVVDVVDDDGQLAELGGTGHIAVRQPDPVAMLSYWRRPEADAEKVVNGWLLTGDVGHKDEDGFLWFTGRADDVITCDGVQFGPGAIEECLTAHGDVALAAAIGVPDPARGEVVKAFVVVREGSSAGSGLGGVLLARGRRDLPVHAAPQAIEFVETLPRTTTGKIMRRELRRREVDRQRGQTRERRPAAARGRRGAREPRGESAGREGTVLADRTRNGASKGRGSG